MKTYWGVEAWLHIRNFGTRWRWVGSFTTRPLYTRRKRLRYPLDGP